MSWKTFAVDTPATLLKKVFDLYNDTTTGNKKWWSGHVPIWTTLTHQGYKVGLHHWSRCDIEFSIEGKPIKPVKCDPYSDHTNDGTEGNGYTDDLQVLKDALDQSVEDLANEVTVFENQQKCLPNHNFTSQKN